MSSQLTELNESSPSELPPSVLCGSVILSQLALHWSMASSGHFDPAQTYDGYKAVKALDPACTKCLAKGKDCFQHHNPRSSKCHFCFVGKKACFHTGPLASNIRIFLWIKNDGPFGKKFSVSEAPTSDGTSGYSNLTGSRQRDVGRWTNAGGPIPVGGRPIYSSSEVPISRINTESVVNRIRQISNSPPATDAEGSDELDVLSTLPTSLPPASPSSSTARPALIPEVRPSPIPQSIHSPIVTSQQLSPVASFSRRREEISPFLFPATQVFQQRENWPIQVTREDQNMSTENQDAVARLF
ncbi:hypothetical protein O181_049929 [Austropuccinia psidii MF-1]|uniref:Uncharacterized protein n=1 Tax=Austropuccinia psidii MF-1 TaxID=1389203 RepID=A0A9Q3DVS7_9BASI|nr:hypothetical protein [Austropuccinia psidii MF-1]